MIGTALVKADEQSVMLAYSREQIDLIKTQVAPKATDDELKLFLYVCQKRGLDPLIKQIYAIHRKSKKFKDEYGNWHDGTPKMTIQTSIDGFRSIADRTQTYLPGSERWQEDPTTGELLSATVTVKKLVANTWGEFSATAHYEEYVPIEKDYKTQEDKPGGQWGKMPKVMLAKCAEAKALRKGWPEQLGGLYIDEEMQQADVGGARLDAIPQETQPREVVHEAVVHEIKRVASKPAEALPESFGPTLPIPASILLSIPPLQHLGGMPIQDMDLPELEMVIEHCDRAHGIWKTRKGVSAHALHILQQIAGSAQMVLDLRNGGAS